MPELTHARTRKSQAFGILILLIFAVLTGRLWYLQVIHEDVYTSLADGNRMRMIPLPAPRGMILDRNGEVLAGNRFAFTVSAVPEGLGGNKDELVQRLADLLDMTEDEIERVLEQSRALYPYEPIRLLRDVGVEAVVALEENKLDLPGVLLEEEWMREYRWRSLAGNTIGYLGPATVEQIQAGYRSTDLVGEAGIERLYESMLRGQDGQVHVEVNALSRPIRTVEQIDPIPGHNVHLTLDIELQHVAENVMRTHMVALRENYPHAWAGAVVVLEAKTGALLALVSVPTYDPNLMIGSSRGAYFSELNNTKGQPFLHRAVRAYPPGSVFKVVTGLAAMDQGAIGPNETYHATGKHLYGKQDWSVRAGLAPAGDVDIRMALARSANDYFWEIASREVMGGPANGIDVLADYARRLGFGQPTGIDFSEMAGIVPDKQWKLQTRNEPWYPGETLDVAIGQGWLTVTPLQMAVAYQAIANRGVIYNPRLVSHVTDVQGTTVWENTPIARDVDIDEAYWEPVVEGLQAAIQNNRGTAYNSLRWSNDEPWGSSAPYNPAGKTGSAQRAANEDPHAWFTGFAPADDPEIVVVVYIEEGGGGGQGAAPIARRIMDHYFGVANELIQPALGDL